ncbi:hypothetical protein Stsp02_64480 [Streptomyces sp. NBRC 14336]|nr:hypothetical protein Stsp02_64480 [Streptomyces sp. NBRC 14336]
MAPVAVAAVNSVAETAATDISLRRTEGEVRKGMPFVAGLRAASERRSVASSSKRRGANREPKSVALRPARRGGDRPLRGYLWVGCAGTIGKQTVIGIQGKPSIRLETNPWRPLIDRLCPFMRRLAPR